MTAVEQRRAIARWEWASLAAILAAFVAIRLPLYTQPGLILGWLFGMMGRVMREGWDFPVLRGFPYLVLLGTQRPPTF